MAHTEEIMSEADYAEMLKLRGQLKATLAANPVEVRQALRDFFAFPAKTGQL